MDYLYTRDYTHEGDPWGLDESRRRLAAAAGADMEPDDELCDEPSDEPLSDLPPEYQDTDMMSIMGEDWE